MIRFEEENIFLLNPDRHVFPEAADEIERNAELLPWKQQKLPFDWLEGENNMITKEHRLLIDDIPEHPRAGVVYELDHGKMALEVSAKLVSLRVVMVSDVTSAQITLRFPSVESLKTFFKQNAERFCHLGTEQQEAIMGTKPELDDELTVTPKVAEQILKRPISCTELLHQCHSTEFWMAEEENDAGHVINDSPRHWAVRRKSSSRRLRGLRVPKDKDERNSKQLIVTAIDSNPEPLNVAAPATSDVVNVSKTLQLRKQLLGRWSADRYMNAQLKLFELLRKEGARPGFPIQRYLLREEARKFIGDTGLLDHLLKHMVDKVIADGKRFRRRHNSEGCMEYWIEDAELMEIRKAAGIDDPFWLPPPGWKPGDTLPDGYGCRGMNPAEAAEMKHLKQEVEFLRSELTRALPVLVDSDHRDEKYLLENSQLLRRKNNESVKSDVEKLKASVEELQSAFVRDVYGESSFFCPESMTSARDECVQESSCRSCIVVAKRLKRLENQVYNIIEGLAAEK